MKASRGSRIFDLANYVFLTIVSLLAIFPIYYVFVVSFTDPTEYLQKSIVLFPEKWSLASYKYLLSAGSFVQSLGVSAFLAIVGTLCSLEL